jgi:hypothetical protein
MELKAKGFSERQMSAKLGIPRSTLNFDLRAMKRTALTNIRFFTEQELPHETDLLIENTNALLKVAWHSLQKDVENDKAPWPGIVSILSIINTKSELLGQKIDVEHITKDTSDEQRISLEDRQQREVFEEQRHREQAIF